MTDQSITSLIEKPEGFETGSRELDWLIADATGHPSFARKIEGFWPPFNERSRADKDVPAYSTSLDAALALAERVLPGWGWLVRSDEERGAFANLTRWDFAPVVDTVSISFGRPVAHAGDPTNGGRAAPVFARTPALALCAAILRAHSEARV
jgi:hypothetical protein